MSSAPPCKCGEFAIKHSCPREVAEISQKLDKATADLALMTKHADEGWALSVTRLKEFQGAAQKLDVALLQIREVWELLESMPSGPGDGMSSTDEDVVAMRAWTTRYRKMKVALHLCGLTKPMGNGETCKAAVGHSGPCDYVEKRVKESSKKCPRCGLPLVDGLYCPRH